MKRLTSFILIVSLRIGQISYNQTIECKGSIQNAGKIYEELK
jgi:hypothetical protein